MNKNNRVTRPILLILTVCLMAVLLTGCLERFARQDQKPMTAQEVYDEALGFWYDTEQNFKMFYEAAAPAEQADMLVFANRLYEAKQILNLWAIHLKGEKATTTDTDKWKRMKNELIFMIANQYRKKEG